MEMLIEGNLAADALGRTALEKIWISTKNAFGIALKFYREVVVERRQKTISTLKSNESPINRL